jgi:hypothetical protein
MSTVAFAPSRSTFGSTLDGLRDNKVSTGLSNTAQALKQVFHVSEWHYYEVPATRISFEQKFKNFTLTWQTETRFLSSPAEIAMNKSYQAIVGMGEKALPLIFEEMQCRPHHWFWALEAITGINPVPKEHRGNLELMTNDWLEWGQTWGHVTA